MPYLRTRIKDLRSEPARYRTVKLFPPPDDRLDTLHGDYRYKMEGQGPRDDPVLRVIVKAILRLRKNDMYLAATDFWIQNLRTDYLWPQTSGSKRVKLYSFKERFEEFPMTIPVRLLRGTKVLTAERIQVEIDGKWGPLIEWLVKHSHEHQTDSRVGEWGLRMQRFWWKKNGRFFPLMQLPEELRFSIYQHILGGNIYPHRSPLGNVTLGPRRRTHTLNENDVEAGCRHEPPNYAILCVSKQVKREALKAAWEGTVKHFVHRHQLEWAVEAFRLPHSTLAQFKWLNFLQLHFSVRDYLSFAGIGINDDLHLVKNVPIGSILRDVPTLKAIELFFRDPYSENFEDPWFTYVGSGYLPYSGDDPNNQDRYRHACYKTVVDWIITSPFPSSNIFLESSSRVVSRLLFSISGIISSSRNTASGI